MSSTSPNDQEETLLSTPTFRPASARRTPSFSSPEYSSDSSFGSSLFSLDEDQFPLFTPGTPLKYKGIPFSWEKIPGIPKHPLGSTKPEYSSGGHLLPLPPAGNTTSTTSTAKKLLHQEEISPKKSNRFQRDPFFAALVECSKEDHDHDDHSTNNNNSNIIWKGSSKITRSLSDRFGFINMYTSCKKTCTVAESVVYLPRPTPHYLLHRRPS